MVTTSRAVVKVTLGWEVTYEFEVWIMPHHAGVDLILGTDLMIPAGIRLDLYNSAVKLPDEMVIPLIRSSNAPTKTELDQISHGEKGDPAVNSAFKLEDVRADRTPVLYDGHDVFNHLPKFEDDGAISDVSTNSVVGGTSAVRAKKDVSATEDSAITEGDPEERSEHALRDAQPVVDNRTKFGVIRPSIVGEVNSAVSTLATISAGITHVMTASSALGEPAARNDLGDVLVCHGATDYAKDECGRVDVCPAIVADSAVQRPSVTTANSKLEVLLSSDVEANSEGLSWTVNTSNHSDEVLQPWRTQMGTPKACIIQSAAVDSASEDLNTESVSDVATACRQDVSYTEDAFARTEVSSAVTTNSADEHSDATKDYDSRGVSLPEGIKPNIDPATADSALEPMEHDDDTIYLGDKFEHAGVRSTFAVNSANMGPDADDNYDLREVSLLEGQAEDDECNSTRDPAETLRQPYLAIATTEDEQEDDVDDGKTDIFERSGTDLELTDYAHELAFLPDLTEVEPTELDYGAPNVKSRGCFELG
ncbi:hypothetical protein PInf_015068 [Phytophthora infestans]|nr:hypothetical protein PInf_015068 [Phytophthora infestans]